MSDKLTLSNIQSFKEQNKPISVLTAYDYSFAKILDEAGVDIILVGDSLANVVLGLESTKDVGIAEMVHHAKAVSRAVEHAFVVGDMPFNSYQIDDADAVGDAQQLIAAGCDAVKVEWFSDCLEVVEQLRSAQVPVMGHIGLTPQTVEELGGYKVQGKTAQEARRIYDEALALEQAGCFAIVMECVPDRVARQITEKLAIPTIGIGAGLDCDGQVLVLHDMLGLYHGKIPKFVRQFENIKQAVLNSIEQYMGVIHSRKFPNDKESFLIDEKEYQAFLDSIDD